jgi:hypothetical protein
MSAATAVAVTAGVAGTQPAGAVTAGQATPARPPALAAGARATTTGLVTGVVRGPDGAPLPGVCVTATGPADSAGTRSVVSLADGRYVLTSLRPGRYTIGYHDCAGPARYFDQWYGGADLPADAARVIVTGGLLARLAPVTLRLTSPAAEVAAARRAGHAGSAVVSAAARAGIISGAVRDRGGRRLDRICVSATGHVGSSMVGFQEATLNKGRYSFPVGTSGTWTVQFAGGCGNTGNWAPQWWRYAATTGKAARLHEKKGRGFAGIDAVLVPGATISGTVTAASGGQPLGGVCVTAAGTGAMRKVQVMARTGSGGQYTVRDLGTGSYQVHFAPDCGQRGSYLSASARAVKVTDGKTTTGINAALSAAASLSGVVASQATGTPVAKTCVDLLSGWSLEQIQTQRDGSYRFSNLRPGRYYVGFSGGCGNSGSYAPASYDGQPTAAGATPITLTAGQAATGISASLAPGGTVTGQLRGTSGPTLRDVCALVTPDETDNPGLLPFPATMLDGLRNELYFTGASGRYRAANLGPGRYQVTFSGCGGGTGNPAQATFAPQGGPGWVFVRPGVTTPGVSAVLPAGGRITGRVTGPAGRPLSGTCVTAYPVHQESAIELLLGSSITSHGKYTLSGLATGRYAVQFSPCARGNYPVQWYGRAASLASARTVSVRAGHTTTGISMRLASGGTVRGKVVAKGSGAPVAGACVTLSDAGGDTSADAFASRAGTYRITHVLPGRWIVQATACETGTTLAGVMLRGERVRASRLTRLATIRLPRAGQVTGTVTGGTGPAAQPGICVAALAASGDALDAYTITGADGGYDLPGLAPGSYRVRFGPYCETGTAALVPQWYAGAASAAAATPVTVTGGKVTTGIGAAMTSDGGITGTVTSNSAPAPGVCVGAYARSAATPAEIAITAADGSYQLPGLTPRKYTVKFTAGCGSTTYRTQWYDGATSRATAAPVTVIAGNMTTGIDAR